MPDRYVKAEFACAERATSPPPESDLRRQGRGSGIGSCCAECSEDSTEQPSAAAPGLWQFARYDRGWLRGDVLAGVTVAAYLIPQVMAYAEVAGLPAVAGLWAVLGPLAVYAVLGTSRQLSVGPESSTALMTAAAVSAMIDGDIDRYADAAAALALAVGVICVLGWVARLGFLANLLSRPVLVGYMAGIAILMIVSQLGKVTGIEVEGDTWSPNWFPWSPELDQIELPTLCLAAVVLALLLAMRRWLPHSPGPLVAMLLAAGAVALFRLDRNGVAIIGDIPRGLPTLAVPDLNSVDISALLPAALGVAMVAYTDNVADRARLRRQAQGYDRRRQEFLALGAANVAAGLCQGFPVSSSGSRTVIADALGSRSQLYSLVALATVVVTVLFLRPVLAAFPTAALGAVVIYAALRLIDVAELRRIARFRRSELLLALATTAAVLIFDVLYGSPSRSPCRSSTCCGGSRGLTTASSATCQEWPACTTSTTIRPVARCRVWWCTATTRRCSSPTPRTSGDARWRRWTQPRAMSSG